MQKAYNKLNIVVNILLVVGTHFNMISILASEDRPIQITLKLYTDTISDNQEYFQLDNE